MGWGSSVIAELPLFRLQDQFIGLAVRYQVDLRYLVAAHFLISVLKKSSAASVN
jgi:hypothetical protein